MRRIGWALLIAAVLLFLIGAVLKVLAPTNQRAETPVVQIQEQHLQRANPEPMISCLQGTERVIERNNDTKTMVIDIEGRPEVNAHGAPVVPMHPKVIICTAFHGR